MKKVIDGKLYDTETAERIGRWDNGLYGGDFSELTETLYRTKRTKRYFLHGDGGAFTWCSHNCGNNSWCGGEKLVPVTEAWAKRWAERKLEPEEYIKAFGEPEEA